MNAERSGYGSYAAVKGHVEDGFNQLPGPLLCQQHAGITPDAVQNDVQQVLVDRFFRGGVRTLKTALTQRVGNIVDHDDGIHGLGLMGMAKQLHLSSQVRTE